MAQARFDAQVLKLAALVGGSLSIARFLYQDLATEAAFHAARHRLAFCKALDAAVEAFSMEYLGSGNATLAHTAACARLEAMAHLREARSSR